MQSTVRPFGSSRHGKRFGWPELALLGAIAASALLFLVSLLVILAIPVNVYQRGSGAVEFAEEMRLTSGAEGLVRQIFKSDFDSVTAGEAVLAYSNEERQDESLLLSDRILHIQKELQTLSNLKSLNAVKTDVVEAKELELKSLIRERSTLDRKLLKAPKSGRLYFSTSPTELLGSYIVKGTPIGYLYSGPEKHVRIDFPSDFVDRFKPGQRLLATYRDPESLFGRRFWATITGIAVDKLAGKIILYAAEAGGDGTLKTMRPGTRIDCYVLLGSKSLLEDVMGPSFRYVAPAFLRRLLETVRDRLPSSLLYLSHAEDTDLPAVSP